MDYSQENLYNNYVCSQTKEDGSIQVSEPAGAIYGEIESFTESQRSQFICDRHTLPTTGIHKDTTH